MSEEDKKNGEQPEGAEIQDEPIPSHDDENLDQDADITEDVDELTEEYFEDAEIVEDDDVETEEDAEDASQMSSDADETENIEEQQAEDEPEPEAEPEVASEPVETRQADPAPPRQSVFIPMLLGGLVAGGAGYGISYAQWSGQGGIEAQLSQQSDVLSALETDVAALSDGPDLTPLMGQFEALAADLSGLSDRLTDTQSEIATVAERLAALERQPNADGTLADTALAAFEAELQTLRDQLASQEQEMLAMADTATERLEATREEAREIEENAVATARKALARTALAQVQTALDAGAPLGALISDLGGSLEDPVPDALVAVTDGAPTLPALQDSFPEAARAALSLARSEGVSGETDGGIGSFLRNQFDVRSVAPKDGDTVDAILSRAESGLRTGQLNDTLAEIAGLPEVVRAALSEWVAQAELRAAAVDAVAQLSDTLNIN